MKNNKDELILNHIPKAMAIAHRFARSHNIYWGIKDLKSAAFLGLVEAAGRFQERGIQFNTFSGKRIVGQVIEEVFFLRGINRKKPNHRPMYVHLVSETTDEYDPTAIAIETLGSVDGDYEKSEWRIDFINALEKTRWTKTEQYFINLCWYGKNNLARAGAICGYTEGRMCQVRKSVIKKLSKKLNTNIDDSGLY